MNVMSPLTIRLHVLSSTSQILTAEPVITMSLMAGARSRSTPAAYLDLDWRDLVTANQIQGRLRALLMDLDDGGYAEITPSESQASKNSLVSTQTTTTNVMDDVPTMVRINKSMRKHIGRNMVSQNILTAYLHNFRDSQCNSHTSPSYTSLQNG